jgi:hypothetical protein
MILVDGMLFVIVLCFFGVVWLLLRSLKREEDLRELLGNYSKGMLERNAIILRLLHEADKHGCDDAELLDEARQMAEVIHSHPYQVEL